MFGTIPSLSSQLGEFCIQNLKPAYIPPLYGNNEGCGTNMHMYILHLFLVENNLQQMDTALVKVD